MLKELLLCLLQIIFIHQNMSSPYHVCYVHCNFCNTVLAVSVPGSTLFSGIVTVRCGHCANLLAVNMGGLLQTNFLQDLQEVQNQNFGTPDSGADGGSRCSSRYNRMPIMNSISTDPEMLPAAVRPPEKRQRVPSAYNKFIKDEIQRIKATNPDITHREAFSNAAKNWAHFPHIHFGLALDGQDKQGKLELNETIDGEEGQASSEGFY